MQGRKPELGNVIPMKAEFDVLRPVPPAPDFMSDEGRKVWDDLTPYLIKLDRLKPEFELQFAAYCEAAGDFIRFTGEIAAFGSFFITETRNGKQEKKRATWGQRKDAMEIMLRLSALFGLTPVDERRLAVSGQGDLFERMMRELKGEA
jgi:P27 family predicted phage terminase small subunit